MIQPGGNNSVIRLEEVWKIYPMGHQEVHAVPCKNTSTAKSMRKQRLAFAISSGI
jgi:hypothetical protein